MTWHKVKIKYQEEQQNGTLKTIVETYLISAVSFTDAETRTYEILGKSEIDFTIAAINKAGYTDILEKDGAEKWWSVKMVYLSIDESKGKEKRVVSNVLTAAESLEEAHNLVKDIFKNTLIPYELEAIALTPILEVHKIEDKAG